MALINVETGKPLEPDTSGTDVVTDTSGTDVVTDTPQAALNIITNSRGLLTKEFKLVDGSITKVSHGDLYRGYIESTTVSLSELPTIIEGLGTNQALNFGALKPEYEGITKLTTTNKVVPGASIARSKNYLEYPPRPTFMMLDYDAKELTPTELHTQLLEVIPEFKGVGMLMANSSSAGVYLLSDAPPTVIKSGVHIHLIVADGSKIPEIGKFIKYRMWAAGYGYIQISASGALLDRNLFDDAVHTPERLVFEATPIKGDGLEQVPRQLVQIEGVALSGEYKLNAEQEKELKNLISLAKAKVKPEAGRIAIGYHTG